MHLPRFLLPVCLALSLRALASDATVAADGSGTHTTVQAAVDAAPAGRTTPWVIAIKPGRYEGHVVVPADKPFLAFHGEDAATTVITDGRNFNTLKPDGTKYSTPDSATAHIQANNFTAENITFENSTTREQKIQALAIYMTGDRGVFRRCRFLGWQDTVRADSPRRPGGSTEPDTPRPEGNARQYFVECYIEGHVDFIYAASTAVFDRCHIHGKADGYITAASTPEAAPFGYVFLDCKVTTGPLVEKGIFLGRPWRKFSATAFIRTELAGNVRAEGWDNWRNPANELTARYAEYASTGPGAKPGERVKWAKQLTDEEAKAYTAEKILAGADGWNPVK
jgi:pectin methylesterase-like acyl-CoA thioesterase